MATTQAAHDDYGNDINAANGSDLPATSCPDETAFDPINPFDLINSFIEP